MLTWLKRYWPWLVALVFLGVYELVALAGQPLTLSALVWHAYAVWPPLKWVVVIVVAVLLWHFFWQKPKGYQGKN
jgi:hypothetical protein